MAKARHYPIVAEQGAEWTLTVLYVDSSGSPIPLSGYTAKMQIRDRHEGSVLIELTDANGKIVLGGAQGTIALKLSGADLLGFVASDHADPHVYDLFVTSGASIPKKVLFGPFINTRAVTR